MLFKDYEMLGIYRAYILYHWRNPGLWPGNLICKMIVIDKCFLCKRGQGYGSPNSIWTSSSSYNQYEYVHLVAWGEKTCDIGIFLIALRSYLSNFLEKKTYKADWWFNNAYEYSYIIIHMNTHYSLCDMIIQ